MEIITNHRFKSLEYFSVVNHYAVIRIYQGNNSLFLLSMIYLVFFSPSSMYLNLDTSAYIENSFKTLKLN